MTLAPDAMTQTFLDDVLAGLNLPRKTLPSKYFYDDRGAELFERICELDEYYLTRTELGIMREHAADMAAAIGPRCTLIELGSGSSIKTRLLLDRLEAPVAYVPIDVSREHLWRSSRRLAAAYPHVRVRPICADFTRDLDVPPVPGEERRVVYFPGSTIGNFAPPEAAALLRRIVAMGSDGVLIGIDLQKDAGALERAYNDATGLTAAFNLNILQRINRELDADFDLSRFEHRAFFNEAHGRIEMHLVTGAAQSVHIAGRTFRFTPGESIRTELSYKYTPGSFAALARTAGLSVRRVWTDANGFFSVQFLS